MKILILSDASPDGMDQGDKIRLAHFIKWLSLKHDITLLCYGNGASNNGKVYEIPPLSLAGKIMRAMSSPLLPLTVVSRKTDRMRKTFEKITGASRFDLVFGYQAKMGAYLPGTPVPAIIDLTDALSLYYGRMAKYCNWPLKLAYRLEQLKMLRFEQRILNQGILCLVASDADAVYLRSFTPDARLAVVPNGVDTNYFKPAKREDGNFELLFVGNMAYPPNRDGILFFYREVLPLVLKECPKSRLVIAGKNPPGCIFALNKDSKVEVTGYVTDVRPYISRASVVISPIRFGAGTRIKILEAMAMGKAIVTTTLGCEGLDVTPGDDIEIADTPKDIAAKIIILMNDSEKNQAMGMRARETVLEKYEWNNICKALESLIIKETAAQTDNV